MKRYNISIPISGLAYVNVDANSEKEAIEKAWKFIWNKLHKEEEEEECRISEIFEEVDCYVRGGSYPDPSVEEIED